MARPRCCPKRVRLTIAALAAIAGLAIVHGAIFAGVLARGLVGRQRGRANHRHYNGTDNLCESLHTSLNFHQHRKLRQKNFMRGDNLSC